MQLWVDPWAVPCVQGLRLIGVNCHAELAAGAAREVHDFTAAAAPLARTPEQGMSLYTEAAKKLSRLLASMTDLVVAVGQAHLLRQRIATQLRSITGCTIKLSHRHLSRCSHGVKRRVIRLRVCRQAKRRSRGHLCQRLTVSANVRVPPP
jgi:hypothetical protein